MTARIAYRNLADAATLTASSQLVLTPVGLLQQSHVLRRWRSTGASASVVADLRELATIDVCAVMGLTANRIRVRFSSEDPTGAAGDIHDSGIVDVDQTYLQAVQLMPAPVDARFVRLDLYGDRFVEAGRLFVGLTEGFEINFSYGWSLGWRDPSGRKKTEGGQTQVKRRVKTRAIELTFDNLTEAETRGLVESIDSSNGLTDDVLFVVDPNGDSLARDTIFGLMTDLSPNTGAVFGRFRKSYSIEGRL